MCCRGDRFNTTVYNNITKEVSSANLRKLLVMLHDISLMYIKQEGP